MQKADWKNSLAMSNACRSSTLNDSRYKATIFAVSVALLMDLFLFVNIKLRLNINF